MPDIDQRYPSASGGEYVIFGSVVDVVEQVVPGVGEVEVYANLLDGTQVLVGTYATAPTVELETDQEQAPHQDGSECCDRHEGLLSSLSAKVRALEEENKRQQQEITSLGNRLNQLPQGSPDLEGRVRRLEEEDLVLEDFDLTPIIREVLGL